MSQLHARLAEISHASSTHPLAKPLRRYFHAIANEVCIVLVSHRRRPGRGGVAIKQVRMNAFSLAIVRRLQLVSTSTRCLSLACATITGFEIKLNSSPIRSTNFPRRLRYSPWSSSMVACAAQHHTGWLYRGNSVLVGNPSACIQGAW